MINCSYNPHKNNIGSHLNLITKTLDTYYGKYENGDFNAGIKETTKKSFCESYNLTNLIKQPTCFKNLEKPSCIDLLLTNRPKSFQTTCFIETDYLIFIEWLYLYLKCTFENFHLQLLATGIFLIIIMQTLWILWPKLFLKVKKGNPL